jgi:4-hydroxy-3-methylbut-2-enyl diphosphate reductase
VARLAPQDGTEAVDVTIEDEYFPPPRELRDLLRAVATAVGCMVMAPPDTPAALTDDRAMAASEALAALAS